MMTGRRIGTPLEHRVRQDFLLSRLYEKLFVCRHLRYSSAILRFCSAVSVNEPESSTCLGSGISVWSKISLIALTSPACAALISAKAMTALLDLLDRLTPLFLSSSRISGRAFLSSIRFKRARNPSFAPLGRPLEFPDWPGLNGVKFVISHCSSTVLEYFWVAHFWSAIGNYFVILTKFCSPFLDVLVWSPAMETKLSKLKKLMAKDDWKRALSMASKFPRLGEHKNDIQRGHQAYVNPASYEQLGFNISILKDRGRDALIARYL